MKRKKQYDMLPAAQFADGKRAFFLPVCLDETEGLWYNGMARNTEYTI